MNRITQISFTPGSSTTFVEFSPLIFEILKRSLKGQGSLSIELFGQSRPEINRRGVRRDNDESVICVFLCTFVSCFM